MPVWRMISADADEVRGRAEAWREALGAGAVEESRSMVGGGSLPGESLPTFVLALRPEGQSAGELAERLRLGSPAVVGRVERDALLLDPRTVPSQDHDALVEAVRAALHVA